MEPGVVKPGDAEAWFFVAQIELLNQAWCLVAQIEARRLLRRCLSGTMCHSVRGCRLREILLDM